MVGCMTSPFIKHKHHITTIPQQYSTHGCSRGCIVLVEYWSGLSWDTRVCCSRKGGPEGGREGGREGGEGGREGRPMGTCLGQYSINGVNKATLYSAKTNCMDIIKNTLHATCTQSNFPSSFSFCTVQAVVTYMSHVKVFMTGIKIESRPGISSD